MAEISFHLRTNSFDEVQSWILELSEPDQQKVKLDMDMFSIDEHFYASYTPRIAFEDDSLAIAFKLAFQDSIRGTI